jgi:tripartite-type tricarboxylate transporter receptor subunit TctC
MRINELIMVAALLAGAASGSSAWAQAASGYPARPVRLIVPFAPGGGADVTSRMVAQGLSERLGAQFVPDNRAGANGVIGVGIAAQAPPDGYTLVTITTSHAVNVSVLKHQPYDLVRDLAPVIEFSLQPFVLAINPAVPAKSVQELIALAKAKPGSLSYGSAGSGGILHLSGAMFASIAGIQLNHVPYKGGTPAMIDVMAGQIHMLFSTPLQANPQIKAGKLRALAVTSTRRNASLAELPTMIEAGVPGFDVSQWFGLLAPARTPQPIIATLNATSARILNAPDMKARLALEGADVVAGTPEEFGRHLRAEIAKWRKLVDQIGLKPE